MSKVIVRLERESSSLAGTSAASNSTSNVEKPLLVLEDNTSFDNLLKDIKNKAKNLNFISDDKCTNFRLKQSAEEEVCLSSDQDVWMFIDQFKNPNTKKENKILSFKLLMATSPPSNNATTSNIKK